MNRDFVEMLAALSGAGADYLVVGAHALAAHGLPRATGDLVIWVRATPENAERVRAALEAFGAPLDNLKPQDLWTEGVARPDVMERSLLPQQHHEDLERAEEGEHVAPHLERGPRPRRGRVLPLDRRPRRP